MRVLSLFLALVTLTVSVAVAREVATFLNAPVALQGDTVPSSTPLLNVHQTLPNDGQPGVATAAGVFGITVPPGYTGYPWALSSTATSRASDPQTQVAGAYPAGYTLGGSPAWGVNAVARDTLKGEAGLPATLVGAEIGVGKANPQSFGVGAYVLSEGPQPANVGVMVKGAPGASWGVGMNIEVDAVPLMLREVDAAGKVKAAWRFVTQDGWLRVERDPSGTGEFTTFSVAYAVGPDGVVYLGGAPIAPGNTTPQPSLAVLPNGQGVVLYGPLYQMGR